MKIHEYREMMKYLTRPSRKVTEEKVKKELKLPPETKASGSKILDWINYNNKIGGTNTQPITEEEKQVAKDIETYQNPPEVKDKEILKLEKRIANAKGYIKKPKDKKEQWRYESWADGLEERTRPKKKIIKKTLIAKKDLPKDWKPKYLKMNPKIKFLSVSHE